jgi:membrane-associated phospholipid phosphatase
MLELLLTVALLLAAFAVRRASSHRETRWRGGLFFDARAREVLRGRTRRGRYWAARTSDVLFYTLVVYPGFVDGLLVCFVVQGDWWQASQVFLLDLEGFTASAFVMFALQRYVSRERPYATFPDEGVYAPVYPERFRSFFSGHAASAFTGATLILLHHLYVPVLGAAWHLAVTVACFAAATAVALLRVVCDRHWLTDALTGMIVGIGCGWLVPAILHGGAGRLLHGG